MRLALFGLAIGLLIAGSTHADRRTAVDADLRIAATANDAVDVADQFSDALIAGELDIVKSLLADDVLVLESGGVEASRDQYFEHHAAADAKFLAGAIVTVKRRVARAEKRSAWIATEAEIKTASGSLIQSTETLALEKRQGKWKIVHIHWSSR